MKDKPYKIILLVGCLLALVAAVIAIRWPDRIDTVPRPPPGVTPPQTENPTVAVPTPDQPEPDLTGTEQPTDPQQDPVAAVTPPVDSPVSPDPVGDPEPQPEPSWEFTQEELDAEADAYVAVAIGKHRVAVGKEFDVQVLMEAPPLQAVVLAMEFDRAVVEPVSRSGKSVGDVFREEVEFFHHKTDGKMTLFCATRPGKKNVLPADNQVVARFRMRAKAVGTTLIGPDEKGIKFLGGSGRLLDYEFTDGEIVVVP